MLELPDLELNTTMINMLRALTDSMPEQMGNVSRDGNLKKTKRNIRDQNHCNRNEEYLW